MSRMFGTDGVRGVAGTELTIELAMKLGQAGAYVLTKRRRISRRSSWAAIPGFREACLQMH